MLGPGKCRLQPQKTLWANNSGQSQHSTLVIVSVACKPTYAPYGCMPCSYLATRQQLVSKQAACCAVGPALRGQNPECPLQAVQNCMSTQEGCRRKQDRRSPALFKTAQTNAQGEDVPLMGHACTHTPMQSHREGGATH